jgi:hypothetical protein
MTALDKWLEQATSALSKESVAQVRREIGDHYESAREAAMAAGATAEAAEQRAFSALGDARIANRHYRRVLLTAIEARLLRDDNFEPRVLRTGNSWFRWPLLALAIGALAAAAALYQAGAAPLARVALAMGGGTIFWLAVPLHALARPRFPWTQMAGRGRRILAGIGTGRVGVVRPDPAAGRASRVERMEAGRNSPEALHSGVAQAPVSLSDFVMPH